MEGRTFKVNLAHIARPITEEKKQTNIYFWSMVGINFKKKNPQGINIPLSELALPDFHSQLGRRGLVKTQTPSRGTETA